MTREVGILHSTAGVSSTASRSLGGTSAPSLLRAGVLCLVVGMVGCQGGEGPAAGVPEAGSASMFEADASGPVGEDAAVSDAGEESDAGLPLEDAMVMDGGVPDGTVPEAGPMCSPNGTPCTSGDTCCSGHCQAFINSCAEPVPLPACDAPYPEVGNAPYCAATTRECVRDCESLHPEGAARSDCTAACLMVDPLGPRPEDGIDCFTCLGRQIAACWSSRCHAEISAYRCCTERHCPAGGDCPECADTEAPLAICTATMASDCASWSGGNVQTARCFRSE